MAKRPQVRIKPVTAPSDDPGNPVERQRDLYAQLDRAKDQDRPVYVTVDDRAAGAQTHAMLAEMVADLGLRVRANPRRTSFKIDRKHRH